MVMMLAMVMATDSSGTGKVATFLTIRFLRTASAKVTVAVIVVVARRAQPIARLPMVAAKPEVAILLAGVVMVSARLAQPIACQPACGLLADARCINVRGVMRPRDTRLDTLGMLTLTP